ncbi:DUF4062 domain-containing protein [Rhodococcus erythropolis]
MEKRYQVFVSSTYVDLVEERRQVTQALLELDCLPAAMEMFVATDDDQWTLIEEVIDQSDYYVLIVGARYGSETADGISYTEKEFDYAVKTKTPVLAFVHRDPDSVAQGKTDKDDDAREKLAKFRAKVMTNRVVSEFGDAHELGSAVSRSLVRTMRKKPGVGWVRGNLAMTVEQEREIVDLREQLARAKDEKLAAQTALVEDVGGLAQGSDEVKLSVMVKDQHRYSETEDAVLTATTTWDRIFGDIGPIMVDEATDKAVRSRLSAHLYLSSVSPEDAAVKENFLRPLPSIYLDEWDMVVVQLRALGLIDKGPKKRPVNDDSKYLALTDKGDRHLTFLRAIRRDENQEPSA